MLWRLTIWSFRDGLPDLSNFYCLPGRAGGSPNGLAIPQNRQPLWPRATQQMNSRPPPTVRWSAITARRSLAFGMCSNRLPLGRDLLSQPIRRVSQTGGSGTIGLDFARAADTITKNPEVRGEKASESNGF